MSNDIDFVNYVLEQFESQTSVIAKNMFGGHGLFQEGLMFGLIAENQLYLKVDDETVSLFIEAECEQFQYQKKDKTFSMSYYLAPEEFFEDIEAAQRWSDRAFEAALRADKKKSKNKKPRKSKNN